MKGKVENRKDGRVEIICFGPDVKNLIKELDRLKSETSFGIRKISFSSYIPISGEKYSDFSVQRSDDQSESIWALRGAGIRFRESTKQVEQIYKVLIERDERLAKGRLLSLKYELIEVLIKLHDTNPNENKDRIVTTALASNIEYPTVSDDSFVFPLVETFYGIKDFQLYSFGRAEISILESTITSFLDRIEKLLLAHNV